MFAPSSIDAAGRVKTILVLAQHPELAEAVGAALAPEHYRIIHRLSFEEADPLFSGGLVDACLVDTQPALAGGIWSIEKMRAGAPQCPILIYKEGAAWEWEEEAYVAGVAYVLSKPVRGRLLRVLIERSLQEAPARTSQRPTPPRPAAPRSIASAPDPGQRAFHSLGIMRDFSAILSHSLSADALLREFLPMLRKVIGVNRAAIFLKQPFATFGGKASDSRRFRTACALGLSPGLLEHFELSFESGIGAYLFREGRILRSDSPEAAGDPEMQREFELIGAQVAVPVLDRETLVGVAAFDGRVTGEPLTNEELEIVFHLLEEVGLAVKNIWLHDQLALNHAMLGDVLRELSSACVVISQNLDVLHANKAARQFLAGDSRRHAKMTFADLPQVLGSKLYQVLKTGTGVASFNFSPPGRSNDLFLVNIVPFQKPNAASPDSALLIMEDQTQREQLRRLEVEASNLRLVRTMAERLAHEIGNAFVPISVHQKLLPREYADAEFKVSLETALTEGVKSISRLISQMMYLAQDAPGSIEPIDVRALVEDAFADAQKYCPERSALLKLTNPSEVGQVSGHRAGLRHALCEILINALQASPPMSQISVQTHSEPDAGGNLWTHIEVVDNGAGFSADTAKHAADPFFTTRDAGLGLGLTVSRKIIETHRGRLSIDPTDTGHCGLVRVSLSAGVWGI